MTTGASGGMVLKMLPVSQTIEQFKALDLRDPCFLRAAIDILARTHRATSSVDFASSGSLPVVLGGSEFAIKFFPPVFAEAFKNEVTALRFLSKCAVPKLLDSGFIDDWQYVLMSHLPGQSLKALWPCLSSDAQRLACRDVGQGLRKIHEIPLRSDFDKSSWSNFLSSQKAACVDRHTKLGLPAELVSQIPNFLESVDLAPRKICFLHTEVMKDHVFFESDRFESSASVVGELKFSGFLDFEPSMVGDADYDFASVGVFLSSADRPMLRSFFEGYGELDRASSVEIRRRVMAFTLLHKYSNLTWYLKFMPSANSFEALADLWWAT